MSAPEFPWTPEKDGLLRSMGAAGESTAAIATLLKRTPDAVRRRARSPITMARSAFSAPVLVVGTPSSMPARGKTSTHASTSGAAAW
jgi:hypothetical protein